jgi:catechol 2,3-dioxygenase-like lactoylglutathione lyase family enzyme
MEGPTGGRAFHRYAFVAVTTRDLARAKAFWVDALGCAVTEEEPGDYVIVDAGGLRLCIDLEDGDTHRLGGSDPVIGLEVDSLPRALSRIAERGILPIEAPVAGERGSWARLRDPDGRVVVLTEAD